MFSVLQMLLALFAFASVVLADPIFRGPLGTGIVFPRPIIPGRLFGRQVPVLTKDSPASDAVPARPNYEAPAAAPSALPPVAAGIPGRTRLG